MAGRTPPEAVRNFIEPLQSAISCITRSPINIRGGYYVSDKPLPLVLGDGNPIRLTGRRLFLAVQQLYVVVRAEGDLGPWKVSIVSYAYSLEDDAGAGLHYNWHPVGTSEIKSPHLHLRNSGCRIASTDLGNAHLPTGRIALEEVLRISINDFGVRPLKDDWQEIIGNTQARFEGWRTWAGSGPTNVE